MELARGSDTVSRRMIKSSMMTAARQNGMTAKVS